MILPATAPTMNLDDAADPDVEQMKALQGGRDSALNELIERWQGPLIAFFMRSTGGAAEAADLAQETFVRVYQNRDRYRADGRFSAWLFTIAANLARNFARWRSRHPEAELSPDLPMEGFAQAEPSPDQALEARERAAAVRRAILSLAPEMREALILYTYHDLSYREIAKIQGSTEKTVENRLYRGRLLLKEKLAGLLD